MGTEVYRAFTEESIKQKVVLLATDCIGERKQKKHPPCRILHSLVFRPS